jgi:hypothetical protein
MLLREAAIARNFRFSGNRLRCKYYFGIANFLGYGFAESGRDYNTVDVR